MLFSSRKTEKLLGKLDKKSIHLSAFSYELIQVTQKRIFKIGKVFKSYRLLNDNSILYKCVLSIQKIIVRHFVKCVLIQPILKIPQWSFHSFNKNLQSIYSVPDTLPGFADTVGSRKVSCGAQNPIEETNVNQKITEINVKLHCGETTV